MKDGNTQIDGPDVVLAAEATQPVTMVLHELVTNAVKYGAFSNGRGRVSVCWRKQSNGSAASELVLEWREAGGLPIAACNSPGYGTSVIRNSSPTSSEAPWTMNSQLTARDAECIYLPNG